MNTTINISLPTSMLTDVKKSMGKFGFTSVSEFFRDAVRHYLYPAVTENGFTREFEKRILESAKEPISKSKTWKSVEDIDNYFGKLEKKLKRHAKNHKNR